MYLQQSSLYRQYILALKWNVAIVDGAHIFYKKFPLIGGIAKIQRPKKLPAVSKVVAFLNSVGIKKIAVEAEYSMDPKKFSTWCNQLRRHTHLIASPFIPTKTILIDLKTPEEIIFQRFSEAKRRAVRKAQKNNVQIYESTNIRNLMDIKNKSAGLFGFIVTWGIDKLWPIFAPKNAAIILASSSHLSSRPPSRDPSSNHFFNWIPGQARNDNRVVGGVLLLFWKKIAYYWIAGATKKGKKLFTPTLLVWEALKLSKQRGCTAFDFVGVWDERLPHYGGTWKGFTKFKEGFGGEEIYYPIVAK
ncbi:peptidoglycan bridge formation glycyltransferase FemA/FemB family protein [Candidatus Gottesmanbacteria bacterium]|nr:peptidoglycan bridge formation glycyltransferase FemA/FemB family protein [Candidatus Gottesmanbacteria bacterium]